LIVSDATDPLALVVFLHLLVLFVAGLPHFEPLPGPRAGAGDLAADAHLACWDFDDDERHVTQQPARAAQRQLGLPAGQDDRRKSEVKSPAAARILT
jgi:hypothetical protein